LLTIITDFPASYFIRPFLDNNKINFIFIFNESNIRSSDFYLNHNKQKYLNKKKYNYFIRLYNLFLNKHLFKGEVCLCGWDYFEYWIIIFIFRPKIIHMILESTIIESDMNFFKTWFKKVYLKNISKIIIPGQPHLSLLKKLKINTNKTIIIGGVGHHLWYQEKSPLKKLKFPIINILYVGRLSIEKGVFKLIEIAKLNKNLIFNIVGTGPLENELKNICIFYNLKNVIFHGHINNVNLDYYYQNNDIFIMPSNSEVWCLAIEEALHFNLPVLISDNVGCKIDLVENNSIGLIFEHNNLLDFNNKLLLLLDQDNYQNIYNNILISNYKNINKYSNLLELLKN
jgi:glycosyltransferase involved in cell wall biosynthesis